MCRHRSPATMTRISLGIASLWNSIGFHLVNPSLPLSCPLPFSGIPAGRGRNNDSRRLLPRDLCPRRPSGAKIGRPMIDSAHRAVLGSFLVLRCSSTSCGSPGSGRWQRSSLSSCILGFFSGKLAQDVAWIRRLCRSRRGRVDTALHPSAFPPAKSVSSISPVLVLRPLIFDRSSTPLKANISKCEFESTFERPEPIVPV
jgi:hypothetical protein